VHDTDESDGEGIGTSQDTKAITVRSGGAVSPVHRRNCHFLGVATVEKWQFH
jgi:hypothetical protein